jgi:tRNA dimethylallyltransferase
MTLPLVAVLGPTGSGKSELALVLAEAFAGEIVNCDSLQVFRHFDIGTAKLPEGERRGVPHYLLDVADPNEVFTAGGYARVARETVEGISARGKLPILAGGTGFYFRALVDGLFPGPTRDDALRARLADRERRRPGSLHKLLRRFDAASAARIHANDVPKVTRALEIRLLSDRPASELFGEGRDALPGYRTLKLGLLPEREALNPRLDERCKRMFEGGLVEEVRHILELGFAPECKPFESHGYRQALQLINGELGPRDALFYAQRNTRQYAKRQITWFRREQGLEWLRGFGDDAQIQNAAVTRVRRFLHDAPAAA